MPYPRLPDTIDRFLFEHRLWKSWLSLAFHLGSTGFFLLKIFGVTSPSALLMLAVMAANLLGFARSCVVYSRARRLLRSIPPV